MNSIYPIPDLSLYIEYIGDSLLSPTIQAIALPTPFFVATDLETGTPTLCSSSNLDITYLDGSNNAIVISAQPMEFVGGHPQHPPKF